MKRIRTYHDLFDLVRERPGMYMGKGALERLDTYVHGFAHGAGNRGRCLGLGEPLYWHFYDFVAAVYRRPAGMGWCRIISDAACRDHLSEFGLFYELLDQFRKLRWSKVWELRCPRGMRRSGRGGRTSGKKILHLPVPTRIQVFQYPMQGMPFYLRYFVRGKIEDLRHPNFNTLDKAMAFLHFEFRLGNRAGAQPGNADAHT